MNKLDVWACKIHSYCQHKVQLFLYVFFPAPLFFVCCSSFIFVTLAALFQPSLHTNKILFEHWFRTIHLNRLLRDFYFQLQTIISILWLCLKVSYKRNWNTTKKIICDNSIWIVIVAVDSFLFHKFHRFPPKMRWLFDTKSIFIGNCDIAMEKWNYCDSDMKIIGMMA